MTRLPKNLWPLFLAGLIWSLSIPGNLLASAPEPPDNPLIDQGINSYLNGDFAKAVTLFQGPAEAGDGTSQFCLGHILTQGGPGVLRDFQTGLKWLKAAAAQGSVSALAELGNIYLGKFSESPADYPEAEKALRAAALMVKGEEAFPRSGAIRSSAYLLAEMYRRGLLGKSNLSEACRFYAIAEQHYDAQEQNRICSSAIDIENNLIAVASEAASGNPEASGNMGILFFCRDHFQEAYSWLQHSGEGKNPDFSALRAELLLEGKGCGKDIKAGLDFMQKAGESGSLRAQQNLARLYFFGEEFPKDMEKAYFWAILAQRSGERQHLNAHMDILVARLRKLLPPERERHIRENAEKARPEIPVTP
jgi:TPR repeat protein